MNIAMPTIKELRSAGEAGEVLLEQVRERVRHIEVRAAWNSGDPNLGGKVP